MYWAAAKTGIVIVPVSTLLQGAGLKQLLTDLDSSMVIADASFQNTLDGIREDLPAIQADRYILVGADSVPTGYISYDDFVADAGVIEPPDAALKDDDVYNIMYSSGTTGLPKGIVHNHYVRVSYCTLFASAFRMTPESVALHAGAIIFNGAMMDFMPWMYLGCKYILHESFDPARMMDDIEKHKVTHNHGSITDHRPSQSSRV